jgi:uncharacterized membrane protein
MPFCSQCGKAVAPADIYCGRCGARQPGPTPGAESAGPAGPSPFKGLESINAKTASILCYIPWVGWIAAIAVLASQRFRHDRAIRFHAFQGLYIFVAWLIADQVVRPIFNSIRMPVYAVIEMALLGLSVFMMVKAAHEEAYALPLFGELAHRSVTED